MKNEKDELIARPADLPSPTYWPFFLALGVVFIFWGILTTWIITGMGLVIFSVALAGWIRDIHKEIIKDEDDGL